MVNDIPRGAIVVSCEGNSYLKKDIYTHTYLNIEKFTKLRDNLIQTN